MAFYPKAVKRLIPPGPNDPPIKARVAILHVADSEAASLYNWFNGPSGGVESHFYVLRDGTVEQYRDTAFQADANVMANDFAISIETQGKAAGTWEPAQLNAIKALLVWLRDVHGIPLVQCPTWNGSGVGYHILFEDQWDQRHASCPGPDRITQFRTAFVPWMASTRVQSGPASSIPAIFTHPIAKVIQKVTGAALVVDGSMGPATVRQWQKVMGTPVDGVISRPSSLIRAVQTRCGAPVDGTLGPQTWRAIQRRLGVTPDGTLGPVTIKALQRKLNGGQF